MDAWTQVLADEVASTCACPAPPVQQGPEGKVAEVKLVVVKSVEGVETVEVQASATREATGEAARGEVGAAGEESGGQRGEAAGRLGQADVDLVQLAREEKKTPLKAGRGNPTWDPVYLWQPDPRFAKLMSSKPRKMVWKPYPKAPQSTAHLPASASA